MSGKRLGFLTVFFLCAAAVTASMLAGSPQMGGHVPSQAPPMIGKVVPDTVCQGESNLITIAGNNYQSGAVLTFLLPAKGGLSLMLDVTPEQTKVKVAPTLGSQDDPSIYVVWTKTVSPTMIEAAVTAADNAPLGPRDVRVTNPDGRQGILKKGFQVVTPEKPVAGKCGGSGVPCTKWQCQKCGEIWECSKSQCPNPKCKGGGLECRKWQCQKCGEIWECSKSQCPNPKCKGGGLECRKWQCQKCDRIWECSSNKCPN